MEKFIASVSTNDDTPKNKVTVVGVGQVGMAITFSILTQNVSNNIVLIDVDENKLKGEMMDLQHGSIFMNNPTIHSSTDYSATADSSLCIVTAGARQREGETRLDLIQKNTEIYKSIIPKLVQYSPDAILLIVSNPVDVLTYISWKLSGLPRHRVIGSGTNLDSSRFRFLLSQKLGIAPTSCHGFIIGEHGDSSVPVWSGVNIAGVHLKDMFPHIETTDKDEWHKIHMQVVQSAYEVIKLKGYTSWAVGLSAADIAKSLLFNINKIHPVSVCCQGLHGVEDEVFLSLPAVIGSNGVTSVIIQNLSDDEKEKFKSSAEALKDAQKSVDKML